MTDFSRRTKQGESLSGARSALGLTAREHFMLARLMDDSSREKQGDGPWERAWQPPRNPVDSRTMASLHKQGLIERRPGRPSAKLPHSYRWRAKP